MTKSSPLRIALAGCGPIGTLHASGIAQSPHAELVAVCDLDARRADSLGERYSVDRYESCQAMLDQAAPHALMIATPDDQHLEPAMMAIERGIHLFCEKPLAQTAAEAVSIADAAAAAGIHCGVDFNRRFGFGYQTARELLTREPLMIRQIVFEVLDGIPTKAASLPYAIFTSLISHHLDLLHWFAGPTQSVYAVSDDPASDHPHTVTLIARSRNGTMGTIHAAWRRDQTRTAETARFVTDQQVVLVEDVQRGVVCWEQCPDRRTEYRPAFFKDDRSFYQTVIDHVDAFLEAIARRERPPVTAIDACATLQVIEAAKASIRSGRPVTISDDYAKLQRARS